jgi:hypothetical protein
MDATKTTPDIAVLIPCFNEARTIRKVVGDFRLSLPKASIFVYDNNSSDHSAAIAQAAGAIVRKEEQQGKGAVVRRMFADVEADIYLLVDGDDTYDAASAPALINLCLSGQFDLVNGARQSDFREAFRPGHRFGNKTLSYLIARIFGMRIKDMLSGYKVFSRRYVKSFPAASLGFEIETELVVHALELRLPVTECATQYRKRPEGSASKLRTFRDGACILAFIAHLVKQERPLQFFGTLGVLAALISIFLGTSIVIEFMKTGLVPRLPTALLSTGTMLCAVLSLFVGLILDAVARTHREVKRLNYLLHAAPQSSTTKEAFTEVSTSPSLASSNNSSLVSSNT